MLSSASRIINNENKKEQDKKKFKLKTMRTIRSTIVEELTSKGLLNKASTAHNSVKENGNNIMCIDEILSKDKLRKFRELKKHFSMVDKNARYNISIT